MESVESGKWRSEWVSRDIAEWSGMVWSMEWYGVVRSGMVEKLQTHQIPSKLSQDFQPFLSRDCMPSSL